MATHDYVIDNSTGANVRADLNLVLQAILSNNSSSSAPSTTAAYMWWADTNAGVLKIRNSANNDWVELLQLDGTITLEDGSASAPALANRGDLDTGVFFGAANQFNVATGGVERLKIDSTAVVYNEGGAAVDFRIESDTNANCFMLDASQSSIGINVAPATGYGLDILGISGYDDVFRLTAVGTNIGPRINLTPTGTGVARINATANNFQLQQGGTTALTIDTNGSVGIGTTSPLSGAKLTVASLSLAITGQNTAHSANSLRIGEEGSGLAQLRAYGADTSNAGSFQFTTSNSDGTGGSTNALRITSDGKLLVGQNSDTDGQICMQGVLAFSAGGSGTAGTSNARPNISRGADGQLLLAAGKDSGSSIRFDVAASASTNAAEIARFDSSGRFMIGQTSAGVPFTVTAAASAFGGQNTTGVFGDTASFAAGVGGGITLSGRYNSSSSQVGFAAIRGRKENSTDGDYDGVLTFATRPNGGVMTEQMRINSSGRVGIGTTSPTNVLEVDNGSSQCFARISTTNTGSGVAGLIIANSSKTAYNDGIKIKHGAGVALVTGLDDTSICRFSPLDGASGNFHVFGALSKGSGSFLIDHPLESKKDTHNLVHSFVEAPQADLIYRGKIALSDGSATVNIDTVSGMSEGTFVALNRNVQCFTTNETGWSAVKGSVSGNILTITAEDNSCSDTISWLVIGERQDQHMKETTWTDNDGKVIVEPLKA